MKRRLIMQLCFLALSLPVPAHAQALRGWVMDDATGRAIRGASVSVLHVLADTVLAVRVTGEGPFQVFMREAGNYRLRAEALGYAAMTTDPVRLPEGLVVTLELRLRANAIALAPLRVLAERNEPTFMRDVRERQAAGWGRFLTREDLNDRAGSIDQLLAGEPGVSVALVPDPGQPTRAVPFIQTSRGSARLRECYASLYVDGHRVFSADRLVDEETREDAIARVREYMDLRASDLEAVEIYRGAAELPAVYSGSTSECGVVAVWTRSGFDPAPDMRERPDLDVSLAAIRTSLSGTHAPREALGPEVSLRWQRTPRFWIGARLQYAVYELSAPTTADLTRRLDPQAYQLPPGPRQLNMFVAGPEAYYAVLGGERLRGVLSARINYARRTFTVNHAAASAATYRSRAWGMGGSAGVAFAPFSRFAIDATVGHDWLYFNAYPNLDMPDLRTAATWRALSFRLGFSFAAVTGGG